jgi:DNA-binding PadR family transcriptional regulator
VNITLVEDFLPLTPHAYHVLLALAEGPMYGNGVFERCEIDTFGGVNFTRQSVYRTLHRLEKVGFVASEQSFGADSYRPRQYYEITPTGLYALEQETKRYEAAIRLATHRLNLFRMRNLSSPPVEILH